MWMQAAASPRAAGWGCGSWHHLPMCTLLSRSPPGQIALLFPFGDFFSLRFLHLCRGRTCCNFLHWPSSLLPPRGIGMSLVWESQRWRGNGDREGHRHLEVTLDSYRNQGGGGACWQQELGLCGSKAMQQKGNSLQDCKQKLRCRRLGRGRCGRDSAGSKAGSSIH